MPSLALAGFTLRPAAPGDFDPVLALISAQNTLDYGEALVSAGSLRASWESPALDLAQNTWVAFAPGGELAGYAELLPDPPASFDISLYLADGPQRLELGAHLLQLAGQRAAASSAVPFALYSRVSAANQPGVQIFTSLGYALRLSFLIMERNLEAPPEPAQWPPGITVRAFVPGQDEQTVFQADEEASQDKGYHTPLSYAGWAARMSLDTPGFDPSLWFLACHGSEIAGVALNFFAPASHTAWVDHLGVRRPWRSQGIGKALLLHSFAEFQRRGIPQARLSVDSKSLTHAPRLYARAGMQTIQEYHIFKKEHTAHLQSRG